MDFSELPSLTRVKLTEEAENLLWERIGEVEGIKSFSRENNYSASKLYNLKSKDCFLPIGILRDVLEEEKISDYVLAIKGKGRGKPISNPVMPFPEDDELLTRVSVSVSVNSNRTPVYQTDDTGNLERFIDLLDICGEVPYRVYSREIYELRYPCFLQQLFDQMSFEQDITALTDEEGEVRDQKLFFPGGKMEVSRFSGRLYHRDKKLDLALARNNSQRVREIMSEEARRVEEFLG